MDRMRQGRRSERMSVQSIAATKPLSDAAAVSATEIIAYDPRTRALIEGPIAATLESGSKA